MALAYPINGTAMPAAIITEVLHLIQTMAPKPIATSHKLQQQEPCIIIAW